MSTTARDLTRRLWVLLALAAATTIALFGAYRGVHDDAVPLASSSAPGVLAVDTAQSALVQARTSAQGASRDSGGTGDFTTQISVAYQSLALAAADDVTGLSGRQSLQTITGLIAVYSGWVEEAAHQPDGLLHDAYLHYADSTLGAVKGTASDDASVMGRLDDLQRRQLAVVHGQTSFGPLLWCGWITALALGALTLAALAEAHRFSRARFRRRWNRPLLAAGLLLPAGTAVLGVFTWWTHDGMFHSRNLLDDAPAALSSLSSDPGVGRFLEGAGFRAGVGDWILAGGALLMALIVAGLLPRINEYRPRASR
jgi:hypothetical protein